MDMGEEEQHRSSPSQVRTPTCRRISGKKKVNNSPFYILFNVLGETFSYRHFQSGFILLLLKVILHKAWFFCDDVGFLVWFRFVVLFVYSFLIFYGF